MSVSDNICLANAWMGSISVSGVTLSHCHTAGAHKTLDTQADHCPHNNLASLLLTATPVSKQTIIPLELYTVYIYYRDTHVKVKIHLLC